MTRQNGSINGEQLTGANPPGIWDLNDAQQKATRGEWGTGVAQIRYLCVGGGGGGGGARPSEINAGGGGGGGVVTGYVDLHEGRRYQVNVGPPGDHGSTYTPGNRGGSSEFESPDPYAPPDYPGTGFKHKAYGGGGGRSYNGSPTNMQHGASGGGASSNPGPTVGGGGLNPTIGSGPTSIPAPYVPQEFGDYVPGTTQGYNGGQNANPPTDAGGGGGGGAGSAGGNASGKYGGAGGNGVANDITGSTVYYGAGGGGGGPSGGGAGGTGGGGAGGGPVPTSEGRPGSPGTGYGAGGGGAATRPGNPGTGLTGGKGGKGVVMLRFPNAFELDVSEVPTAPPSPTSPYNLRIDGIQQIGNDTLIMFGGQANNIKFKRK